ncbi:MAG: FtsQ-type POTRA domain-containing protein [Anaerolineales bacterium]|nr:FtsQ-type POTRA domain-containing protein [Anaerolineales bacterium]MCB9127953.1 FtsQ-type POTRA domain-containing protein [Ardenticatenales bacterium]MCB9171715.1 FtsQ-type POTRA domain-containing protein [Ardenticatenales bacterium]
MSRRTSKPSWSERLFGQGSPRKGQRSQRQRKAVVASSGGAGRNRLLLALILAGALLYLMFGTSWFYIYELELDGARLLGQEEAYNRSQLEGWSLFWLNPTSVAARLKEDPLILDALVSPKPPNGVRIQVQERLPVAVWQSQGQSYFVDGEGVLFALRGDARRHIVVRDLGDGAVQVGERVDVNALQAARELTRWMPERRAWDWAAGEGISFLSDEGWRVVLGDQSQIATKVRAYRAFRDQQQESEGPAIVLLDVSVPEHAYFRTNTAIVE